MEFPRLFSPIQVGGCLLPNRIMSTAAVTRLAEEDGHITEAITSRYRRMAKGGLGAMVVEAAVVLPSKSSFNLRISDDGFVDELRTFVESIRSANPEVKIGLQLIHFLKLSRSGWRQKPEDLREEEIQAIPEQFAEGALRAKKAGFDFVELHMAHFTTLASFLSLVNKRMDQWGGDFEGRVHLPGEVILAVRESVGTGYPVGIRMNGEEFTKEGNTLLQSERIARRLAGLGVDYISVSAGERFEDAEPSLPNSPPFAGTGYSGYRMSPRWWNPDGVQVYLAEGIRNALRAAGYDIPIVTAGKIRTPKHAEEILEKGRADVIGMARALLCDPDWPRKAREGRSGQIVKCAACGFCSEADERYEKVTCIQWPKSALNPPSPWLLSPPCSAACPAGINIREYVDLTTQGNYEEALQVIREHCPFPDVVSRICPAFCEKKCNRAKFDEPIAVNPLKRFLVERMGVEHNCPEQVPRTRKERVAVVGSGPAGLTAAYYLVRMGYGATVYEALPVPGGMMSVGIQESRLPRDLVNAEIENIRRAGVEIRTSSPVGVKGVPLESLMQQGFKAIFLAVGTKRKRELRLPGGEPVGFAIGEIPDLSFLEDSPLKQSCKNVIETDPQTLKTNVEGVFAGGDMVHGPTSVIQAVASGRRAAFSIHKYLSGETHETGDAEPLTIGIDAVNVDRFKKRRRQESPKTGAYDENTAMREADRCFQCGMFPKK